MKAFIVYNTIQQLKERGFEKDSIAKQLGINWRTVNRYYNMNPDEYVFWSQKLQRIQNLSNYKEQITSWIKDYPSISAAQICD